MVQHGSSVPVQMEIEREREREREKEKERERERERFLTSSKRECVTQVFRAVSWLQPCYVIISAKRVKVFPNFPFY